MIDGKVCNALTYKCYQQKCYIFGATQNDEWGIKKPSC